MKQSAKSGFRNVLLTNYYGENSQRIKKRGKFKFKNAQLTY